MVDARRFLSAGLRTGRQPAMASSAMVSSPHPSATLVGLDVLRAGGSAVDAAIAASAALMVTVPHQCSPGGDGFWIIRPPFGGSLVLNASGRSGATTDADRLRSAGYVRIPERSAAAVTVPGVIDGWIAAHERFGRLELERLLRPAIELARRGVPVSPYMARQLQTADHVLALRPETDRRFRSGGRPLRVGHLLRLPELADTLAAIAAEPRSMYEGELADRIVRTVTDEGGCLNLGDMASHRSEWTESVSAAVGPWQVEECPPNSQGWVALLGATLLERSSSGWSTAAMVEASKIMMTVRDREAADTGKMAGYPRQLLDLSFVDAAAERVDGGPPLTTSSLAALTGARRGAPPSRGDTAHLAIVDRDGLAVSSILSLYFDFGSGVAVPETGVVLHNRGAAFTLQRGHPNELRAGKRPLHTLAPALATLGGHTAAVFGAMGGDAQVQIHLQLLEGLIRRSLDPATAIARPRWFVRQRDGEFEVLIEERHRGARGLAAAGNRVTRVGPFDEAMGHAQAILVDQNRGVLIASADPRSDGIALGW